MYATERGQRALLCPPSLLRPLLAVPTAWPLRPAFSLPAVPAGDLAGLAAPASLLCPAAVPAALAASAKPAEVVVYSCCTCYSRYAYCAWPPSLAVPAAVCSRVIEIKEPQPGTGKAAVEVRPYIHDTHAPTPFTDHHLLLETTKAAQGWGTRVALIKFSARPHRCVHSI